MMRRVFLRLLVVWAALLPAGAQVRHLTILHTNDLHAHLLPDAENRGGFAQIAAVLNRERDGCNHCVYLNAGDLVQGTPVSTLFRGTPVYEIANKLRIDAATLGNHEFDYGWQQAANFIRIANYPVVSANIVDQANKTMIEPYVIKTINGLRIGIIGAVLEDLVSADLTPELAGPYRALPVVETVSRYAKQLRDRTDIIIVLAHIFPEEGDEVLKHVPEVSVVVEGHSHRGLEKPIEENGRVVVGCRAYGVEVGRLDLEVDAGRKKIASWQWKLLPVNAAAAPADAEMKSAVDAWEQRVSKLVDVNIGEAKRDFEREGLQHLIEQAMQEEEHADFAFMNGGGVRDRLLKGPIQARHIWNILPFDDRVAVVKIPGERVAAEIRGGRAVDPQRQYTLAVPDFVMENENQRTHLGLTGVRAETQRSTLRDVVIQWIRRKKVLE